MVTWSFRYALFNFSEKVWNASHWQDKKFSLKSSFLCLRKSTMVVNSWQVKQLDSQHTSGTQKFCHFHSTPACLIKRCSFKVGTLGAYTAARHPPHPDAPWAPTGGTTAPVQIFFNSSVKVSLGKTLNFKLLLWVRPAPFMAAPPSSVCECGRMRSKIVKCFGYR